MTKPQPQRKERRTERYSKRGGYPATKPISSLKPPTDKPGPGAKPSGNGKSAAR